MIGIMPSRLSHLSREELEQLVLDQARVIAALEGRIAELERALAAKGGRPPRTSKNSSRPPSGDQKSNRPAGQGRKQRPPVGRASGSGRATAGVILPALRRRCFGATASLPTSL